MDKHWKHWNTMGGGVSDATTRAAGGGGTGAVAGTRFVLAALGGLPRRRAVGGAALGASSAGRTAGVTEETGFCIDVMRGDVSKCAAGRIASFISKALSKKK